jgi:hypothetical protein
MLIDVAIPGDRNVTKKDAEKILKYKDLIIEIQSTWNVKTKVTPVIIGATATISKSFRKYLISVPGKHDIKELYKAAILGTAHILRKVLSRSTKEFRFEDSVRCTISSRGRIAAALYTVETRFVSGM